MAEAPGRLDPPPPPPNMPLSIPADVETGLYSEPSTWAETALAPYLGNVWDKHAGVQDILHESGVAERLASFYCSSESRLHISKEAASQISNVPAMELEPLLSMFATALTELDRASRVHLEHQVAASGCKLICYLDLAKYDETPMRVRSSHVLEQLLGGPPTRAGGQHEGPQPVAYAEGSRPGQANAPIAASSKLLQTESKFAMLVQLPEKEVDAAKPPRYCMISGTSLSWMQSLEKGTSLCLRKALSRVHAVSHSATQFASRLRVATTDEAASNKATEKSIAASLSPGWDALHFHCIVNLHEKALGCWTPM